MEGHGVGLGEHLVHRNQRNLYGDLLDIASAELDLDVDGSTPSRSTPMTHATSESVLATDADAAKPDNAERLAAEFDALGVGLFQHLELLRPAPACRVVQERAGEQVGHDQLGCALRTGRGCVEHHLARPAGVVDVEEDAASDKAEVRAGDEVPTDLALRTRIA